MKRENIERAKELIEQRAELVGIINKFETEEISFVDECGKTFETPSESVVEILIELYESMLVMVDNEIERL